MDTTRTHQQAEQHRHGPRDLLGHARTWLSSRGIGRELISFAVIGVASTAAYALLYLVLRTGLGSSAANAVALVITAIGNTAANRRLTFGVHGGRSMLRDQAGGLVALGVALVITTTAANLLAELVPHAGRALELAVLVLANALATVARFVLLRTWLAGDRSRASQPAPSASRIQP
jgi:putative flippase GtrA